MTTPDVHEDVRDQDLTAEARERRLHPVTPLRRAWAPVAIVLGWAVHDLNEAQRRLAQLTATTLLIGVSVLIPAAALYGFLTWWFTHFSVTDAELRIRTGLLFRRTAHIRLDRIQAVDVTQPLLARFVGVAKLKLDVIGADKKDELTYLGEREARELRAELLARAAGFAPETVRDVGEAPAEQILHVPPRMLAVSLLLTGGPWAMLLAAVVVPALLWFATHNLWTVLAVAVPLAGGSRHEQRGPLHQGVRLDGGRVAGRPAHRPRPPRPRPRDGAAGTGADRTDRGASAVAAARLGARGTGRGRLRRTPSSCRSRPARSRRAWWNGCFPG